MGVAGYTQDYDWSYYLWTDRLQESPRDWSHLQKCLVSVTSGLTNAENKK